MFFSSKLYVGCDHAGFLLKNHLMNVFSTLPWQDLGAFSEESVDYPDFAAKVTEALKADPNGAGLLICGSGQGMVIKANRYPHIRAALCWTPEVAKLARAHNNANVLCLGSRVMEFSNCEEILDTFLKTDFEGGRHQKRVSKL